MSAKDWLRQNWIGLAVLAVILAVLTTLTFLRREPGATFIERID